MRNHIKEDGLTAVHRAMDSLATAARKHLSGKAQYHGKEFPFIYRLYEITAIPDRHTEGGDAVVSHFIPTMPPEPTNPILCTAP